ncbi:hypothetical protein ACGFIV_00990 [Sphaerisporangium sp. NPDC049003]|uniref:hypothetical protein n=1 Tax=Sphaerisporangium sp. NPDC049003 TaxID=3364517 RepID=UPI0037219016
MTISQSGLLVATIRNNLIGGTQTSLVHAGNKIAFFGDALVPNFSQAAPVYGVAPYDTGEISGLGLSAGGVLMDTPVLVDSGGGLLKWDAGDVSVPGTTLSGITGMVIFGSGQGNRVIAVVVAPDGPHETQNGLLGVVWDPLGIADWDVVPTP